MRLGIVGCGAIGRTLVEGLDDFASVTTVVLFDRRAELAKALTKGHPKASVAKSLDELVAASDLVVESASQEAAREVVPRALSAGKSVLVMSLGALSDDALWAQATKAAKESKGRLLLPSGALGGLEAVASASHDGLDEVRLTTRKPPAALEGVEYLRARKVSLEGLKGPLVVFDGSAREAVRHFPANINVAAALSLAGIGFDRTRVVIVADPQATTNRHEVYARGAFGELRCEVSNVPSRSNPKTSHLAALSALAAVKNAASGLHFGP